MRCIETSAYYLEQKYSRNDLSLLWEYIGDERRHGDAYYDESRYCWFEFVTEPFILKSTSNKPIAVVCLADDKFLPLSLHLSFIEVLTHLRGKGYGTMIIEDLLRYAKSMNYEWLTLQTRDDSLVEFYSKFGFERRAIGGIPIMLISL